VPAASQTPLELCITRVIDDGLHEDIDLTNFTTETSSFVFRIELDADFADQGETRERKQHGERTVQWDRDAQRLTFDYTARNRDQTLNRSVNIEIANATSAADWNDGRLAFQVTLAAKERWHACVRRSARTK
jgi:hypothetical protein